MDDPIANGSARRDVLAEIVAADQVAAEKRERKERRIFRIAAAAVAVLTLAVGLFAWLAFESIDNQRAARAAASRRIDLLNEELQDLGSQLVAEARSNGNRIGELTAQIDALREQVRQLGGEPIIVVSSSPSSDSTTTSTTAPPPSTTTTTTTTAPAPPRRCVLGVVCLPGSRSA